MPVRSRAEGKERRLMPTEIINRQTEVPVSQELMEAISRVVSLALNLTTHSDSYEVAVSLVGNDEIARLNSAYRGVEGVTDVLSFPMCEPGELAVYDPPEGDIAVLPDIPDIQPPEESLAGDACDLLGDIVICMPRAVEQAADYGHSLIREVCYLAVHGALHLLGYDHENTEDQARMRRVEEYVMSAMGLAG